MRFRFWKMFNFANAMHLVTLFLLASKIIKGDLTLSFQFCLFSPVVVWAMCFGGISSVLPFPVLAFFLLPPLFRISLSGYLMWIVSQRCLSCLSCLQGHSLGFTAKSPPSASQRSYLAVKPCIRSHDTFWDDIIKSSPKVVDATRGKNKKTILKFKHYNIQKIYERKR